MNHIRATAILGSFSAAILAAGCSTTSPGVTYYDVSTPQKTKAAKGVSDVFALDKAKLKITFPAGSKSKSPASSTNTAGNNAIQTDADSKEEKEAPKTQVKVDLEILEDSRYRIGIGGANDYRKTTTVNIEKRENTDMVKSVGVATTENLKNTITKFGTLLAAILPLSAREDCKKIDLEIDTQGKAEVINEVAGNCATYTIGALPSDAIKYSEIPWGTEVTHFYYAACRTIEVKLTAVGATDETLKFKMPDPYFVQAVQIPFKGSIRKHSTCGVSTITEATASPTASIEALTELITQINAIKAAGDKK